MTPFEQKLSAIPRREIPAEWRTDILSKAALRRRSLPAFVLALFKNTLSFPHPLAWGAVAACWVVIAALNFSGPRGNELYAVTPKNYQGRLPTVQEYLIQLEIQKRLYAEIKALNLETEALAPVPLYRPRPQDL